MQTKPKKKPRPSVSVLIAAHNEEKFIGRCIRSMLNQTFPIDDYEIIVVNDASTDRTQYALELFGDEIKVIKNTEKLGLPGSLNKGIQFARGQFLVRLDGDDYVSAEYLNILTLFLRLNPHFDAVACDYILVDDHEVVLGRKNCMEEPLGCGIMFRMEQMLEVGMYDPDFQFHEDRELRARFLKKFKIHRIELPLYRYRRHDQNMTNDLSSMKRYERALFEKHGFDA